MTALVPTPKVLISLVAVAATSLALTACGSSSSGGNGGPGGAATAFSGATPSGYTTISEKIGGQQFSVAVPQGWKASAVDNTGGGYFMVLITANGAALNDQSAISANTGGVVLLWNARTTETAAQEIREQDTNSSTEHVLSHATMAVTVPGTTAAQLLTTSFRNSAGTTSKSAILAANTKRGGLIDVQAYALASAGNAFSPSASVHSLTIH